MDHSAGRAENERAGWAPAAGGHGGGPAGLVGQLRDAEHYRRQLEVVANNASLALFIMDERQHCSYMNPAAERLTGYALAEVLGRSFHDVFHHMRPDGTPYPQEECPIARALPRNAREQGEEVFVRKDGSFYPVAFTASPLHEGERTVGAIVELRDTTREREFERQRREEAQLVDTLQRVGSVLASKLDLAEVVQAVTDEATALTGAQFGAFFYNVTDERGDSYTLYTISGVPRESFSSFPMPRNTLVFGPTFHGEGVVRSADITKDPRYGQNAPYHGMPPGHLPVRSYLAVPVVSRAGGVLGGLFFGHSEPDRFAERHERLAVGIAGWAVVAIDNARLFAAEQRARQEAERATTRVERLQTVSAALAAALTVSEVADVIARQGSAALGAGAGVVALIDATGESLEYAGWVGYPPDARGEWQHLPLAYRAPLTDAARRGEPVWVGSPEELSAAWPEFARVAQLIPTGAWGAVPLVLDRGTEREQVLGAMGLSFGAPREFPADVRALAEALAQQGAQALGRALLYAEAEAARADAEAANRAKSEFLAVMSHELRTPLNAIGGYAELMEMGIRGAVTAQQREDLRRIQTSQRHLLGLINEVLNYAKLETGSVHFDVADVLVHEALGAAEALVAPQARVKGLTVVVGDTPPELTVRADGDKLAQILLNLLSNAIKFTDRGGRIDLTCAVDGDRVRLVVRDTGIGIPPDKLEAIFEPFVQVRADLTRTAEGTGLGLAISRDLARGMGGDLTAESEPGAGSTFTLTLPHRADTAG
ncbi:MAG: ATP-binding protein [Gemmatimonadaceae bacterium]